MDPWAWLDCLPNAHQPNSPPARLFARGPSPRACFAFNPSCKRNPGHNATNQCPTHHTPQKTLPGLRFFSRPARRSEQKRTHQPCNRTILRIVAYYTAPFSLRLGVVSSMMHFSQHFYFISFMLCMNQALPKQIKLRQSKLSSSLGLIPHCFGSIHHIPSQQCTHSASSLHFCNSTGDVINHETTSQLQVCTSLAGDGISRLVEFFPGQATSGVQAPKSCP